MNEELSKIMKWLTCNKLSLNINKTKYMLFKHNKNQLSSSSELKLDNHKLEEVKSIKFLGIILDNELKWEDHIFYIKKKVAKSIGILVKCKRYLNSSTLTTLYYAFLYPYFFYAIEIWGSAHLRLLNSLFKLQKKL